MKGLISLILTAALALGAVISVGAADTPKFSGPFAEKAYGHLLELMKIPRGSGNEKAVSDYLMEFASKNGLEAVQDKTLNVLIRKPGSKGRENEPPVILQAHMDMVCEKNANVEHDFTKDPIIPVIDGDWLHANGTTLGADDGSGVSMIMTLLESKDLSHPPIEALITTREETDMGGAMNFDVSLLTGKRFINVDWEEEKSFAASSASATDVDIAVPVEYEAVPDGFSAYTLMISGLTGGHSGIDINKGRANANILAAHMLVKLGGVSDIRVSSIEGGSMKNAIPRECKVVVLFNESSLNAVIAAVREAESGFKAIYPDDSSLKITLEKAGAPNNVMKAESLNKVIGGILLTPNGPQSMSPSIEGLVQTSNNLGIITTEQSKVLLSSFVRSSTIFDQELLIENMETLAGVIGAQIVVNRQSPPWEFQEISPMRDKLVAVYKEVFGKEPEITAVHAGLECAVFTPKMSDCEFISIGPDIVGAHSPDEKLNIPSYDRMCGYLVKLLEQL